MTLISKVKTMFGITPKPKPLDTISADVKNAVQRNETASNRVREALEEYRMTDTIRNVTGRIR